MRLARAIVDLAAIQHNVRVLQRVVAPSGLWAVVKADGYGHGAVEVSRAAIEAGAEGLCVALVQEGIELRRAGLEAPILVLSEQPLGQLGDLVAHRLTPTVYSMSAISALAAVAPPGYGVHIKVDTGMQRVGCDPAELALLLASVAAAGLVVDGVFTHLALADEPSSPVNTLQLDRFDAAVAGLDPAIATHVANSAGALAHPRARRSFVRAGIAVCGLCPGPGVEPWFGDFQPALSLVAGVAHVKRVAAGSAVSYGHRHVFPRETTVATVPIGYADGVPRGLSAAGGHVLIRGQRCPIRGVITMDQLVVEVADGIVEPGDEVVLIGRQGNEQITADEWASLMNTISYEIVCGISRRVPRVYT